MKKIILIATVLIIAGCKSTGEKIISNIESECKIHTTGTKTPMGEMFYWYMLAEKENPFKIDETAKGIIDKTLNCLPTEEKMDEFIPYTGESSNYHKWETPTIEIKQYFYWSSKGSYSLKFWIRTK